MRTHGVARTPATPVRARRAAHDDDTPVPPILRRRVGVAAFARRLGHGGWGVLEREEGRHGVRLEASLQVRGCRGVDGRWAQETGGADPDVETAPGVEDVVDEREGVGFRSDVVGVSDHFRVRVQLGHFGGDLVVPVVVVLAAGWWGEKGSVGVCVDGDHVVCALARELTVDASCAVGCELERDCLAHWLRRSCHDTDEAKLGARFR